MNYLYDTTPSCFIILYISICQYSLFSIPTFQLSKMVRHAVNKHSGMRRHSGTLSRVAKAKRSLALAKNKTGQQEFLLPNVKNQLAKEMQYADFRNNLVCPVIMRKKKKSNGISTLQYRKLVNANVAQTSPIHRLVDKTQ